jgi:recombinational DNA repair protein (RecF pathway)
MSSKKCCKCGAVIDTDNEEYLTTADGILCINCANNNTFESSYEEVEQTMMNDQHDCVDQSL